MHEVEPLVLDALERLTPSTTAKIGVVMAGRVDPALRSRILRENEERPIRRVVSNIFGFGGNNCSLVLGVL